MRQAEHDEQVALMAWAKETEEQHPELALLFAVPNGGARNAVTGRHLKQEGVKRGVPDLWLPVARCGYHGLVSELKASAKRRPSPEQVRWLNDLKAQGWLALLCVGAVEAKRIISGYLGGTYTEAILDNGSH